MRIMRQLALGLLLALAAGGCGSTGGSHGVATANSHSSGTPSASASAGNDREKGLKFARCMREHGIDMPDPEDNGAIKIPGVVDDPTKMEAAMQECKAYLPNGGQAQKPDQQQLEQLRKLARCMRDNGVKNFPDPDPNGGIKADGIDQNDPTVQKAQQACAKLQPGGPVATDQGTRP